MKQKTLPPSSENSHPYCLICKDGTYATMSLRIFREEDCDWTHYCERCGDAMASVVKEGQKRDPKRKELPPPPVPSEVAARPEPVADVPKPSVKKAKPIPPSPPSPPAKALGKPAEKAPSLRSALEVQGHDLLELMGWKR